MSNQPAIACPHCGKRYAMTREYIAQYGGRETPCAKCGNAMLLPRSWDEVVPPDPAEESVAAVNVQDGPTGAPVLSYSAPDITPMETDGVWRDKGETVVMMRGAKLPARCYVCATPTDIPSKEVALRWLDPKKRKRVGLMALWGGWLPSLLMYHGSAEVIKVNLCRCPQHGYPWYLKSAGAVICMLALLVAAIATGYPNSAFHAVLMVVVLLMVITGIVLVLFPYPLKVSAVEKGYAWIKGFASPFRKSLPSLADAYKAQVAEDARRLEQL